MKNKVYFKSFEQDRGVYVTKTRDIESGKREVCQNLLDVIRDGIIHPNTVHKQFPKRLCVSHPTAGYRGQYRPEGLLFETTQQPAFCAPFDLMALTRGKSFTSAEFEETLLDASERFIYDDLEKMLALYPSSSVPLAELTAFRKKNGLVAVNREKLRYNECCFVDAVHILPVGLVGGDAMREIARKLDISVYGSVGHYLHTLR